MEHERKKKGRATAIDKYIGENLKKRRMQIGMSQEKLGQDAGTTFQQIQKYENGSNRISAGRLHQFAGILDWPIEYFFDGYEGKYKYPTVKIMQNLSDDALKLMETIRTIKNENTKKDVIKAATALVKLYLDGKSK